MYSVFRLLAGFAACTGEALGQEAQELELRVDAGLEAPVRLEDQLVAEDDRRVRLLGPDRPGGAARVIDDSGKKGDANKAVIDALIAKKRVPVMIAVSIALAVVCARKAITTAHQRLETAA